MNTKAHAARPMLRSVAGPARLLSRPLAGLTLLLALTACDSRTTLYTGLTEKDANEVTASLLERGLDARKESGGKQLYAVAVPTRDFSLAVEVLRANGLPRHAYTRMGDVFKKDGMISSPVEERARYLAALSQELESTLSQIDGVVVARVHPVLPERVVAGEPVLPSSCSVMIKHVPGWSPARYEARIRQLVLASIPGLAESPDKVAVVFVPAEAAESAPALRAGTATVAAPEPSGGGRERPGGMITTLVASVAILVGLGGPGLWWWLQRRSIRGSARPLAAGLRAPP